MKTTINTGTRQIIVQPSKTARGSVGVIVEMPVNDAVLGVCVTLTQDQAGALIFALEQAAEAAQMADRRVAA